MSHCGNKSVHSSHDSCTGTRSKPLPENIVMSIYHLLMIFLTVVLIHRWMNKHKH